MPARLNLFAACAATLCALPCLAEDAPQEPLAWRIADQDSQIILLGSIHMLRPTDHPLPALIDQAYADADRLVMELDMDDLDPRATAQLSLQLGMGEDADTLRKALGAKVYASASAQLASHGISIEGMAQMEPWFATLTLVNQQLYTLGYTAQFGLEAHLSRRAVRDGKEISGLETMRYQLGLFDDLPRRTQRKMFSQSVTDLGLAREQMDRLVHAWAAGDESTLQSELMQEFEQAPRLYKTLVTRRNRLWSREIERLLAAQDDILIVVGALHLIGKDSVLSLLEQRDLRPERYWASSHSTQVSGPTGFAGPAMRD